jgi:prepilin-type N-terminal cleavage/methylation domain-containing protein
MNKKGFTLIELLIVVVIIGILAAIAIPKFGETRERAYVSAMQADLNQVRTAQEMYYQDNSFQYAGNIGALEADPYGVRLTDGVTVVVTAADNSWIGTATHTATDRSCTYDESIGVIDCPVL